jgi:hypothetical protein
MISLGQVDVQVDIFKTIIDFETEKGSTNLYIQCEATKTFFDKIEFKKESILQVPDSILNELEISSQKGFDTIWSSEIFPIDGYKDIDHFEKCISRDETLKLFKASGKQQSILCISQPIFDSTVEHCVVSISYWKFIGQAHGCSYLLKNVYGNWIVLETFRIWLT